MRRAFHAQSWVARGVSGLQRLESTLRILKSCQRSSSEGISERSLRRRARRGSVDDRRRAHDEPSYRFRKLPSVGTQQRA